MAKNQDDFCGSSNVTLKNHWDFGKSSTVVTWWFTWKMESPDQGIIVSSRPAQAIERARINTINQYMLLTHKQGNNNTKLDAVV